MNFAEEAGKQFMRDRITGVSSLGDGRINDTFCIKTEGKSYVCQRIRSAMNKETLKRNYFLYSEACRKADWCFPEWLKTRDDEYFYEDVNGDHWRAYPMIEGEVLEAPLAKEELQACGQGLARMHGILQTLQEKPIATYPMLHDLNYYHQKYLWVLENNLSGGARDDALEKWIDLRIDDFLSLELDRSAVIHGDPKLANILFQERKVKAFLDFDTIMQGSLLEDVADCVRSCCMRAGRLDEDSMQIFLRSYLNEAPNLLSREELQTLPKVINKIYFELGLRYYADAIARDKHFKEKYPGFLLKKAKTYFNASR